MQTNLKQINAQLLPPALGALYGADSVQSHLYSATSLDKWHVIDMEMGLNLADSAHTVFATKGYYRTLVTKIDSIRIENTRFNYF